MTSISIDSSLIRDIFDKYSYLAPTFFDLLIGIRNNIFEIIRKTPKTIPKISTTIDWKFSELQSFSINLPEIISPRTIIPTPKQPPLIDWKIFLDIKNDFIKQYLNSRTSKQEEFLSKLPFFTFQKLYQRLPVIYQELVNIHSTNTYRESSIEWLRDGYVDLSKIRALIGVELLIGASNSHYNDLPHYLGILCSIVDKRPWGDIASFLGLFESHQTLNNSFKIASEKFPNICKVPSQVLIGLGYDNNNFTSKVSHHRIGRHGTYIATTTTLLWIEPSIFLHTPLNIITSNQLEISTYWRGQLQRKPISTLKSSNWLLSQEQKSILREYLQKEWLIILRDLEASFNASKTTSLTFHHYGFSPPKVPELKTSGIVLPSRNIDSSKKDQLLQAIQSDFKQFNIGYHNIS